MFKNALAIILASMKKTPATWMLGFAILFLAIVLLVRSGNGRYRMYPSSAADYLLDTKTGNVYISLTRDNQWRRKRGWSEFWYVK